MLIKKKKVSRIKRRGGTGKGIPTPPPPPPPPGTGIPPPPPLPPGTVKPPGIVNPPVTGLGSLLKDIKEGRKLRPIPKPIPKPSDPPSTNPLLDAITTGIREKAGFKRSDLIEKEEKDKKEKETLVNKIKCDDKTSLKKLSLYRLKELDDFYNTLKNKYELYSDYYADIREIFNQFKNLITTHQLLNQDSTLNEEKIRIFSDSDDKNDSFITDLRSLFENNFYEDFKTKQTMRREDFITIFNYCYKKYLCELLIKKLPISSFKISSIEKQIHKIFIQFIATLFALIDFDIESLRNKEAENAKAPRAGERITDVLTSETTSGTSGLRSNKSETLMISDEIKINKKFILKSLKYNIYLLILDNYNANKKLYIYLLKDLIDKIFKLDSFSNINIYKIMFEASKLYEQFIQKCLIDPSIISPSIDDDVAKYEKYFKLLLHFMFWTNYISAYNMYALSCIQVFVLLVDDKSEINVFNYINLIFHLSCDLSKTYSTLRKISEIQLLTQAPATQDTSLSDYLEEIKKLLDDIKDTELETDSTTNIQALITKLEKLLPSTTSPPTQSERDNEIKKNIITKLKIILKKREKDLKKLEDLTTEQDDSTKKSNAELDTLKIESRELEKLITEIDGKTKMDELIDYLREYKDAANKESPNNIKKIITKILELHSKEVRESSDKLLSEMEKNKKLEAEKLKIYHELQSTKDAANISESPSPDMNEEDKKIFYFMKIRDYLKVVKSELEAAKTGTDELEKVKAELQTKQAELEAVKAEKNIVGERTKQTALLLQKLGEKIKELNKYKFRGGIYIIQDGEKRSIFTSEENSTDYHILNHEYLENPNEPLFIRLREDQIKDIKHMETDEAKKLKAKLEEISTKMVVKGKKDNVTGMTVFNNGNDSTDYYIFNVSGNSEDHKNYLRNPNEPLFKQINYSQVVDDVTETKQATDPIVYTPLGNKRMMDKYDGIYYPGFIDQYGREYYLKNGNYIPWLWEANPTTYTPPVNYYSPYYRGGGNKENMSQVASLYSTFLNIQSSTTIDTTVPATELEKYKKSVNQDCEDNKPSKNYINAILDLHTGFSFNKKERKDEPLTLYNMVVLQLNLLSTVNINKCGLYNFIKFCNENKDKEIYTFDGEKFVTYIQIKQKAS